MSAETRSLQLKIDNMDNDAFFDDWKVEAARILRAAAKKLEDGKDCFFLFDLNGNKVGELDTYNT